METYYLRIYLPGEKRGLLLGSDGNLVRLTIYAVIFQSQENAEKAKASIEQSNPGITAKVVKAR